jgi:hypothetical protein
VLPERNIPKIGISEYAVFYFAIPTMRQKQLCAIIGMRHSAIATVYCHTTAIVRPSAAYASFKFGPTAQTRKNTSHVINNKRIDLAKIHILRPVRSLITIVVDIDPAYSEIVDAVTSVN